MWLWNLVFCSWPLMYSPTSNAFLNCFTFLLTERFQTAYKMRSILYSFSFCPLLDGFIFLFREPGWFPPSSFSPSFGFFLMFSPCSFPVSQPWGCRENLDKHQCLRCESARTIIKVGTRTSSCSLHRREMAWNFESQESSSSSGTRSSRWGNHSS